MIGQAPARTGDPRKPCTGPPFERLARIAGAQTHREVLRFFACFDRINLLTEYHGKAGRGDAFPRALAKEAAAVIAPYLSGRTVLLVGKNVAWAFGLTLVDYLEWYDVAYAPWRRVVVIPHPSGINRWWNEESNREEARRFFRDLLF